MRHRRKTKYFSRKTNPRKALLRGLVTSLVEHGRIKTTLAKAKELRRHVERAITLGKKDSLHARRLLLAKYPNQKVVDMILTEISPRFKDRNGGYTRVLKISNRPGDCAPQAFIEFVDYDAKAQADKKMTVKVRDGKRKTVKKEMTRAEVQAHNTKLNEAKKFATAKVNRRKSKEDRRVLRSSL
ncbi:MAG: 50S ribosomal protein L17 [Bdellovibrionaceae bacterium]|nr:50S ribosomal protein L17 [Pseudobdellovibrionaceae bacterium]